MNRFEKKLTKVYKNNYWGDDSSKSGPGSNLINTEEIRKKIPDLLRRYNIKSIIDAPCGDFYWMKEISSELDIFLDRYLGVDIVEDLIANNNLNYANEKRIFIKADLTTEILPEYDCIFCRDLMLHLSYKNIYKVIENFKKSGAKYLIISTYTKSRTNKNAPSFLEGGRALNMQMHPFYFPEPIDIITENYTGQDSSYIDKSLAIWELETINLDKHKLLDPLNTIKMIPRLFYYKLSSLHLNIKRMVK